MNNSRRNFLKKTAVTAVGISIGGLGMSAKSYANIIGANNRLKVAFMGCGRRVGAFYEAVINKSNNVELAYICDVMKKQREKTANALVDKLPYQPRLIEDYKIALDDPDLDAVFNATPDHWHAPGTWEALKAGKHVYVEKPSSHNPFEDEITIQMQEKYKKVVQMGNQQRSSIESIEVIKQIHEGIIGDAYKAVAYYSRPRGRVSNPVLAPVPDGLNWDLWQGPAPREPYRHDTWNYNWHWYGWKWGTAETGNNATHELDIGRWALQADYPEKAYVEADKYYFKDDGMEMYDTMEATFVFPGNKIVKWDGKSRTDYQTYCHGSRGTIVFGTEGTVVLNREGYWLYDLTGNQIRGKISAGSEAGTALGGGGSVSTLHVVNFFDVIRDKATQNSPIQEGAKSVLLCHLANIAYRSGKHLPVDKNTGKIKDKEAMSYWGREYAPGYEPD